MIRSLQHHLTPSLSRRSNRWDNAVAESFFGTLKEERIRKRVYKTRQPARADAFDSIEVFYNRQRRPTRFDSGQEPTFAKSYSTTDSMNLRSIFSNSSG